MNAPSSPGLYIVATPIGNLGDLSARAEHVLKHADIILVEDSRVTSKLLNHINIKSKMRVYNDHVSAKERHSIIESIRCKIVALVSDAGTPLVSDPGYRLVRSVREEGLYVTTIPGASAPIAALTLSGLPSDRFLFEGFLPTKKQARETALQALAPVNATLIFFENSKRLGAMLGAALLTLGDRDAAIVREISKKFEETINGTLSELADRYIKETPKGEIVVVIGPPLAAQEASETEVHDALREALTRLPASKAAGEVAKKMGVERRSLFALATAWKDKKGA